MNRERSKELLTNLIEVIKTEYADLKDEDYYLLADMGIRAYNQDFDNDIDTEGQDFSFAFSGYLDIVKGALEIDENTIKDNNEIQHSISNNLLANIRTIAFEEYLQNNLIDKDRELYELLTIEKKVSNDELDEEIKKKILQDNLCGTLVMEFKKVVKDIYTCLLQDSFGLNPYEGIIIVGKSDKYSISIHNNPKFQAIPESSGALKGIVDTLNRQMSIRTTYKRQFDILEIIGVNKENDTYTVESCNDTTDSNYKPYFYPYKIGEYASGSETTYKMDKLCYTPYVKKDTDSSSALSFEDIIEDNVEIKGYYSEYIEPQLFDYVLQAIYYTLKSFPEDKWFTATTEPYIIRSVQRLQRTVCTAVILTKYNVLNTQVTSLAVRVTETNGKISVSSTYDMFNHLSGNKMIQYEDGLVISDVYVSDNPLAYRVIEFSHDFDAKLSNAEPLFGYKAVELYNEKGMNFSWDRILLGRDAKGTPFFSTPEGAQDAHLQSNLVHCIYAGSRVGKGVMTMNIMASAIASKKPIFYLDRKPDMAIVFYGLSGGNMFVINGADTTKLRNDVNNYFGEEGSSNSGWKEKYLALPDYIKELFPAGSYYNNIDYLGDFFYYRSIIFILGIIAARVSYPTHPALGGSNGIIAIIDEFTNFQFNGENKWFDVVNGSFITKCITKSVQAEITKYKTDIKAKKAQLNIIKNDSKKAAQIVKLESDIEILEEKLNKICNNTNIYATQIVNNLQKDIKSIPNLTRAGLQDNEARLSDIFIIGQNISKELAPFPNEKTSAQGFEVGGVNKTMSIVGSLLMSLPKVDWLMGKNADGEKTGSYLSTNYAGQNSGVAQNMIWKKEMFGYTESGSYSSLRTTTPSDMKFFKSYLVLNGSDEPEPGSAQETEPQFEYVAQCRARVNKTANDSNMWEKVRLKHLPKALANDARTGVNKHYGKLNEGIGFKGYIESMRKGEQVDFTQDLGGSKEIADSVAKLMGFKDYKDLIFDLSIDGIFCMNDVVKAIELSDPKAYKASIKERLDKFTEFGFFDSQEDTDTSEEDIASEYIEEEDYDTDYEDTSVDNSNQPTQSSPQPTQSQPQPTQSESFGEETEEDDDVEEALRKYQKDFESDVISSDNANMNTGNQNFDTPVMRNTDLSGEIDDDIFDRDDEDYSQPVQSQPQTVNQLSKEDISAIYDYVIIKINQLIREERRFLTDEEFIALKEKWFNVIESQLKGGIN